MLIGSSYDKAYTSLSGSAWDSTRNCALASGYRNRSAVFGSVGGLWRMEGSPNNARYRAGRDWSLGAKPVVGDDLLAFGAILCTALSIPSVVWCACFSAVRDSILYRQCVGKPIHGDSYRGYGALVHVLRGAEKR